MVSQNKSDVELKDTFLADVNDHFLHIDMDHHSCLVTDEDQKSYLDTVKDQISMSDGPVFKRKLREITFRLWNYLSLNIRKIKRSYYFVLKLSVVETEKFHVCYFMKMIYQ